MIRPLSTALSCAIVLALSQAAVALECSKAKTPVDRAICANPQAHAADDAMTAAYVKLAASLTPADRAALVMSQRQWLTLRTSFCSDGDVKTVSACLQGRTQRRTRFLAGLPETGPGLGAPLVPVFRQAPKPRKGFYQLDVDVLKFAAPATPGEVLFNAEVDKILKDVPSPQKRSEDDMVLNYTVGMRLSFASPQFLSARYDVYDFGGGAHGNSLTRNINIDMRAGRLMRFDMMFKAAALPKLRDACLSDIKAEKAKRMPDEVFDTKAAAATVETTLKAFDHWSLTPGKAKVGFDAYDLGAYAEGEYDCSFDAALTGPLLKPGAQLP